MIRQAFEGELKRLEDETLSMAQLVKVSLVTAVEVLAQRDLEGSRRLIVNDRIINEKRFNIEADCLIAIATQQPMASDLRVLAAILDITGELERIGDYAKGIAHINLMIGDSPLIMPVDRIRRMAEEAQHMLQQALEAFVLRDAGRAQAVPDHDDVVDSLYNCVYRDLMNRLIADPANLEQVNLLLWAAHNLERAADRVTNICERVVFTVTGRMVEMDSEDSGVESLA